MAQKKLQRFADIKTFKNVLEYPGNMQGKWSSFFGNTNPVILELACGRGEYTVGLSKLHTNKNIIGVDVKGNRMYIGAKKCLENNQPNAAFLRTQIEMLPNYFAAGEVDEIWITFPDPQLRTSKAKKRLTHPRFLRLYQQVLKTNGVVHLKTDSPDLFAFTKKVIEHYNLNLIEANNNIYADKDCKPELTIKTHYESLDIAQSKRIHYLQFTLPTIIKDIDDEFQEILKNEESAERK
ncbi:MAG: tRNA (guanosine(46)-N7)-methyltransferase TrmB [Chitinophagaceae bacterium]|nr:tRNA (guanosine(46)-N7)-methyltransferase TrmB [Chitinophagaceae bacterium]